MKLRIQGNSLRIRVGRAELARFLEEGRIEDTVRFAPAPEAKLTYALEAASAEAAQAQVRYSQGDVTVLVTPQQVLQWSQAAEVGIYTKVSLGAAAALDIIIEKDFACLDRSDEDNKDTFVNPNAATAC